MRIKKLFSIIAIIAMSLGSVAPAVYAEEHTETIEARLVRQYNVGQSNVAFRILGNPAKVIFSPSDATREHRRHFYTYQSPSKLYILHQALIIYH